MARPSKLATEPLHLARRLWWSIRVEPLTAVDERWARTFLLPGEIRLWERMPMIDRTHSVIVARRFIVARPAATRAEVAGALLHDVGKILCGLGVFGRVVATVIGPITPRFRRYRDHERLGAELAAQAGSDLATVGLIAEEGPAFSTLKASDHA